RLVRLVPERFGRGDVVLRDLLRRGLAADRRGRRERLGLGPRGRPGRGLDMRLIEYVENVEVRRAERIGRGRAEIRHRGNVRLVRARDADRRHGVGAAFGTAVAAAATAAPAPALALLV